MIMYRKNKNWTTVFISVATDELEHLGHYVEEKLKEQKQLDIKSKKWKTIDIVDKQIVSHSYHPVQEKTFLDMLVSVADLTEEIK